MDKMVFQHLTHEDIFRIWKEESKRLKEREKKSQKIKVNKEEKDESER
jgi:hypothetical protein